MAKPKGEFKRKCRNCGKAFTTDDKRKIYDTPDCGHKFRTRRWFQRAVAAMRQLKQQGAPKPKARSHAKRKTQSDVHDARAAA